MTLRRLARAVALRTGVSVNEAYVALMATDATWGSEDRIEQAITILRREMRCK